MKGIFTVVVKLVLFILWLSWSCKPVLADSPEPDSVEASQADQSSAPNIVFVIADDLGWADVAFHGGNAPTPNLDQLAKASL